jgi:hypothetical protein
MRRCVSLCGLVETRTMGDGGEKGLKGAVSRPDVAAPCQLVAATVNREHAAAVRPTDAELPDRAVMPKAVASVVVQQVRRT